MNQTNQTSNKEDIKQNPKYAIAQEKYRNLVLSLAKGTNYSSFTEGWNFYTDLAVILETERANGHNVTFEKLISDMAKMSDKKLAKKYQAYAIASITRYVRSVEAKKYEERISKTNEEIKHIEQRMKQLAKQGEELKKRSQQMLNLIAEHKEAIAESYLQRSLERIQKGDVVSKFLEVDTIEKARSNVNAVIAANQNQAMQAPRATKESKNSELDEIVKFISE